VPAPRPTGATMPSDNLIAFRLRLRRSASISATNLTAAYKRRRLPYGLQTCRIRARGDRDGGSEVSRCGHPLRSSADGHAGRSNALQHSAPVTSHMNGRKHCETMIVRRGILFTKYEPICCTHALDSDRSLPWMCIYNCILSSLLAGRGSL